MHLILAAESEKIDYTLLLLIEINKGWHHDAVEFADVTHNKQTEGEKQT